MNGLTLKDIKNPNTLNIFTDASIHKIGKDRNGKYEYVGCYGAVAVIGGTIIDSSYKLTANTTNNNSEIKALREGVSLAITHKDKAPIINIFSDSQISVFGVRDRLLNWRFQGGNFIGSTGQVIANQEIFMEIVRLILAHNIRINFLHQAGHVVPTSSSLQSAMHVFRTSNGIRGVVDMNIIRYISEYNNLVDRVSRSIVSAAKKCRINDGIQFIPGVDFDRNRYKLLTQNTLKFGKLS